MALRVSRLVLSISAIKRYSSGAAGLDYLLTELGDILITQDGVSILVEQSNLSTVPDPFEGESYYLTQDGDIISAQVDGRLLVLNLPLVTELLLTQNGDILTDQQGQAIGKQVSL